MERNRASINHQNSHLLTAECVRRMHELSLHGPCVGVNGVAMMQECSMDARSLFEK